MISFFIYHSSPAVLDGGTKTDCAVMQEIKEEAFLIWLYLAFIQLVEKNDNQLTKKDGSHGKYSNFESRILEFKPAVSNFLTQFISTAVKLLRDLHIMQAELIQQDIVPQNCHKKSP